MTKLAQRGTKAHNSSFKARVTQGPGKEGKIYPELAMYGHTTTWDIINFGNYFLHFNAFKIIDIDNQIYLVLSYSKVVSITL